MSVAHLGYTIRKPDRTFAAYPLLPIRQRIVIELKVARRNSAQTLADGLTQTRDYMDRCGEGVVLAFKRRGQRTGGEAAGLHPPTPCFNR